ncbi:MAG: ZIP family metal transporter [Ruminococcus sp.]|nr:ZIP family metal transporter [Ruminococcus sp.]
MNSLVIMALIATLLTWFVTALGSLTVVFFKSPDQTLLNLMLGFASGVMIAASFWSLLQPAIERAAEVSTVPPYLVATSGFLFGAVFMWISDKVVTFARKKADSTQGEPNERLNRVIMLVLSITLHNIPEGLAVGVAFGALGSGSYSTESFMGAVSIALGIGLQNFPEGAAVSFPLRREGYSRKRSFLIGQASGLVEPIAGVLGAILVVYVERILPYALSFAAGAMILVAVHELIPECQRNQKARPYFATMGIVSGFAVMMLLDVMLG